MKTMTIELERPATLEVIEFELPYFAKFNACYYAVIDPLEALRVVYWPTIDAPLIDVVRHASSVKQAFAWEAEPVSREEFFRVYNEALNSVTAKFEKL